SYHFFHIRLTCYLHFFLLFFFKTPAPTEFYTLSLHDALPIFTGSSRSWWPRCASPTGRTTAASAIPPSSGSATTNGRGIANVRRPCRQRRRPRPQRRRRRARRAGA